MMPSVASGPPMHSDGSTTGRVDVSSRSIAVLPFAHLSSDPDDEFFCDGLAEELLNALAKISGLKVAARTSSFLFKGKDANVSDIGQALGVASVLEGSVRKSGSRLRITVQLINAADGYHLWSERYDREMRDIFDVQDEITLAVIEALKLQLLGEQRSALTKRATDNAEAYELYLRGRAVWSNRRYADFHKATEYFKRAIELDPNYALAYSGLADCYSFQAYFEAYPPIEMRSLARSAVDKAIELDETLAESHSSLAMYKCFFEFDGVGGQRELERAIEIDPKSIAARYWYCTLLSARGRFDESIREGYAALEVDPLSSLAATNLVRALLCAGRFDEGIELSKKIFDIVPDFFIAHWLLGWAYCETGETEKGIEHYRKSLIGSSFVLHRYLVKAFVRAGKIDEAQKIVDQLDRQSNKQYMSPLASAIFHAEIGDMKTGLDLLEKAWHLRTSHLMWMGVDPVFDIFRGEPRFQAIWRQMNF
jgi:serine/threonine-protein kinase